MLARKVLAYITRVHGGHLQLLTFVERDLPEAGVQVPAGTAKPGEDLEQALFREIAEESGLTSIRIVRKLAATPEPARGHVRHFFHLETVGPVPDQWRHEVGGDGEDSGMIFEYSWTVLESGTRLAGEQDQWLSLLLKERKSS